jgi:hypothetical protein
MECIMSNLGQGTTGSVVVGNTNAGASYSTLTSVGNIQSTFGTNSLTLSGGSTIAGSVLDFRDDFLYSTTSTNLIWTFTSAGTGQSFGVNLDDVGNGHPGTIKCATGTGTTDQLAIHMLKAGNQGQFVLGGGALTLTWWWNLDQLSSVAQTFSIAMGLTANATYIPTGNGVWFSYTNGTNSGDWVMNSIAASTPTNTNSTTAVATGWQVNQIQVNAGATSINFLTGTTYANLASIGTVTTNIPTSSANPVSPFFQLLKSNGTSPVTCSVDLFSMNQVLTTPR